MAASNYTEIVLYALLQRAGGSTALNAEINEKSE
jgi:hypothetical protein